MRTHIVLLALGVATACASPPPLDDDPEHEAMRIIAGFHEASPAVAGRLESAAGWAAFPSADPNGPGGARTGLLFTPDHAAEPVELHAPRQTPLPRSRHVLVVLSSAADVEQLENGPLALDDAVHLLPHDDLPALDLGATRWVISSELSGLLFEPDTSTSGWELRPPPVRSVP